MVSSAPLTPLETYPHVLPLFRDTGGLVNDVGVVGEHRIATVLREDAESDEDEETVAITLRFEEVQVGTVLLSVDLHRDRLPNLAVFELDGHIVSIAIGVVMGKHFQGLVVSLLCD